MPKGILLNRDGKKIGEAELPEIAFGIKPNESVVHQYVDIYLANQRQGTQKAKTTTEVSGGGKKPWRQKGTGRARVGSSRSPLWRGGGVIFAPTPRDYRKSFPAKMRKLALASVLSARAAEGAVYIFEDLDSSQKKTSAMVAVLKEVGITGKKALFITASPEMNLVKAGGNIKGITVTFTGELNAYQVVNAETLLILNGALPAIEELCKK